MPRCMQRLGRFALWSALAFGSLGSAFGALPCSGGAIKLIVPNPAGGTGDMIARTLAVKAGGILGQPIVVENRSGATTTIGTAAVAKSSPDGCTLLSLTASGVVASVLHERLPYSLDRDFVPLVGVGSFPMVLAVATGSKFQSVDQLASAIRSPKGLAYASAGAGTLAHLSAVSLLKAVGGSATHIPFRGNPEALQALMGEQVEFFFPSSAEAVPLMQGNKIRALAVTSDQRLAAMPTVPTMKELGFANFDPRLWYGFLAPAGTPVATIAALDEAFAKAISDPSVQERLRGLGFVSDLQDGARLAELMKSDAERWRRVVKENGIKSSD